MNTQHMIDQIANELAQIANADGNPTKEETSLIAAIMQEVAKYKSNLDLALEDNKIDQAERIRLFQIKLNIIQKAVAKIKEDMIVSKDEEAIMRGLQDLLPKLSSYEDQLNDP